VAFLISYPFRLTANGSVAVREDGDADYFAEEFACLLLTRPGERELVPEYGIEDPTYEDIDYEELESKIAMFGPPIKLADVYFDYPYDGFLDIELEFEPVNDEGELEDEEDEELDEDEEYGVPYDIQQLEDDLDVLV
jgi:hypothetical protein